MCDASSCTRQPPIVGDPWAVRPLTTSRFLAVACNHNGRGCQWTSADLPGPQASAEPTLPAVNVATSRVFIEGDSLTVGAATALRRRLKAQVRSVHRRESRAPYRRGRCQTAICRSPEANIWVVALGTNDDPSAARRRSAMCHACCASLEGSPRDFGSTSFGRGYGRVNRALHDLDVHSDQLTVIDWAAVIRKNATS